MLSLNEKTSAKKYRFLQIGYNIVNSEHEDWMGSALSNNAQLRGRDVPQSGSGRKRRVRGFYSRQQLLEAILRISNSHLCRKRIVDISLCAMPIVSVAVIGR